MSWVGMRRVDAFAGVRFLIPPSEPDVRVSTHPALHEPVSLGYAISPDDLVGQGVGMFAAR
jgi:hypothetical protein